MTEPGVTYCSECRNVHPASRDENKPWQWRCSRWPRPSGYGWVHPSFSPQPPYHSCREINTDGNCPDFMPIRAAREPGPEDLPGVRAILPDPGE